jgi:hypothetical protein
MIERIIPVWFLIETQRKKYTSFLEIKNFDKLEEILGYLLKKLSKAIKQVIFPRRE